MKQDRTFESANAELDAILAELAGEETPLEQSLALYAKAAELIAFCDDVLKKAQVTVEEIDARFSQCTQPAEEKA